LRDRRDSTKHALDLDTAADAYLNFAAGLLTPAKLLRYPPRPVIGIIQGKTEGLMNFGKNKAFLAAALMGLSGTALADQQQGPTFGIGVGRNDYSVNADATGGFGGSFNTTGWSVFGGYRFTRNFALEAAYLDGGSRGNTVDDVHAKLSQTGYGASALGTLPLGNSFAIYGRAGYMHGKLKASLCDVTGCVRGSTTDNSLWYGAGVWGLLDGAQVRLEYSRADFDLLDAEVVSLNVAWLF
jgi:OOP family OmpA-OmpF porin